MATESRANFQARLAPCRQHEAVSKLCTQSPAPGRYDPKDQSNLGLGAPIFSQEPRSTMAIDNGVPGPGAHKIPDLTKKSNARQAKSYSIAANLRCELANVAIKDNPGPGTYQHVKALGASSTTRTPNSSVLGPGGMNKTGGRASSAPRIRGVTQSMLGSPGPGQYEMPLQAINTGPGIGVSIKKKETGKRYMGLGMTNEYLGTESPGPGQVSVRCSPLPPRHCCDCWYSCLHDKGVN